MTDAPFCALDGVPIFGMKGDVGRIPYAMISAFYPRVWANLRLTIVQLSERGVTPAEGLAIFTNEGASLRGESILASLQNIIDNWERARCHASWGTLHGRFQGIAVENIAGDFARAPSRDRSRKGRGNIRRDNPPGALAWD